MLRVSSMNFPMSTAIIVMNIISDCSILLGILQGLMY